MYMTGGSGDTIDQYTLSTGFDLSTASYDSVSLHVSSQDSSPRSVEFNTDGTKMYLLGSSSVSIHQYSLSTGFDLSTASYDSVSFSVFSQGSSPLDITFNSDGTKIFLAEDTTDTIYRYSLSTAFDLSTASYDSISFSVSSQDISPRDVELNPDGTKMYVLGVVNNKVFQYSLSTAFDISTASYDSVSFSVGSQDASPLGLAFSTDGTKMYLVGNSNDTIYQYSTGL
jgi:DNA-binding beta-propeller fold protein YncE